MLGLANTLPNNRTTYIKLIYVYTKIKVEGIK